jgi:mRNA interferase MazF
MNQRGDVVLVVVQADFGKVRPAVIVQNDMSLEAAESITVCLVTSDLQPDTSVRVNITPTAKNGLKKPSQIQADKLQTVRKEKVRDTIGHIDRISKQRLDIALALHLNLYAPALPGDTQ